MPYRWLLIFVCSLLVGRAQGQRADSLALPGAVLYYYTYGQGTPLVVLSGGPGVASHQEDDVAQRLGQRYRVILFDQRGTGRSRTTPFDSTTINLRQAVAELDALRQHLGLKRLNLYGHSWGPMLGTAYLAAHPRQAGLFVTVGGGPLDEELYEAVTHNQRVRLLPDSAQLRRWSRYATQDAAKSQAEVRRLQVASAIYDSTQLARVMSQVSRGANNRPMGRLMLRSVRRELHPPRPIPGYRGPTLIVYGLNDIVGLTTAPQYLQAFPRAELHGINRCGHYPEIEQPAAFYAVVERFLAAHLRSIPTTPPRLQQ